MDDRILIRWLNAAPEDTTAEMEQLVKDQLLVISTVKLSKTNLAKSWSGSPPTSQHSTTAPRR